MKTKDTMQGLTPEVEVAARHLEARASELADAAGAVLAVSGRDIDVQSRRLLQSALDLYREELREFRRAVPRVR